MSNIISGKNSFLMFNDFFSEIEKNGIRVENISELLNLIIPRDKAGKLLINYRVKEKGVGTAVFSPKFEDIVISINKIIDWLSANSLQLAEMYKVDDVEKLRKYLLLFVITHELEHGYEYLMGKGTYESPCSLVSESYRSLFSLLVTPSYIIPRPVKEVRRVVSLIKYKQRENNFLLERNANIEAFDLLSKLALENADEELYHAFLNMKNCFMLQGYADSTEGSISETFRNILMSDKYRKMNKENNLSMEDKVRFGLEIDEETRAKVLRFSLK